MEEVTIILFTIAMICVVYGLYNWFIGRHQHTDSRRTYPYEDRRVYRKDKFDDSAIVWCAIFLSIDQQILKNLLYNNVYYMYTGFRLRKRSGGYRHIARPRKTLMDIQKTIHHKILAPVHIHPTVTGFRKGFSIMDNAQRHLGKDEIIKTDILHFFPSIKKDKVIQVFEKIGYPKHISYVLAELCCLSGQLPQGAPTSPALSNIISYEMDRKLSALSSRYGLTYTRYADDLTFSGSQLKPEQILPAIKKIVNEEGFSINHKKTRYISQGKRKIITGISISSGNKLTLPKAKKREIRKNVHFILSKGLAEHQRFIKSTDPVYLKRLIGYLSFWKTVEPENKFVTDSIRALYELQKDKTTGFTR